MAFCFKKKETIAKAARRLACECVEDALAALERGDRLRAVHEVRKEIKKARAILRLARDEVGKFFYRKGNQRLREAADCLKSARDAQAKLNAFEKLTHHFGRKFSARPFPKIKKLLKENCRAEERRFLRGDSIAKAKRILREARRQVDDLKMKTDGWPAIAPGLKRSFGRGQQSLEMVLSEPSPENFHKWRKRVKDLWYHLRLLCPAWPKELRAASGELETLGEFLGDDHDLVMLREFVADACGKTEGIKLLNELIESRQKELRASALKLGARFFSEKPSAFCRRFENYWKIWRAESKK